MVGDVRDPKIVKKALKGIDAVNNSGTATLLEALIEKPVEKLIVASSMSIYGEGLYQAPNGTVVPGQERGLAQLQTV